MQHARTWALAPPPVHTPRGTWVSVNLNPFQVQSEAQIAPRLSLESEPLKSRCRNRSSDTARCLVPSRLQAGAGANNAFRAVSNLPDDSPRSFSPGGLTEVAQPLPGQDPRLQPGLSWPEGPHASLPDTCSRPQGWWHKPFCQPGRPRVPRLSPWWQSSGPQAKGTTHAGSQVKLRTTRRPRYFHSETESPTQLKPSLPASRLGPAHARARPPSSPHLGVVGRASQAGPVAASRLFRRTEFPSGILRRHHLGFKYLPRPAGAAPPRASQEGPRRRVPAHSTMVALLAEPGSAPLLRRSELQFPEPSRRRKDPGSSGTVGRDAARLGRNFGAAVPAPEMSRRGGFP